MVEKCSKLAPLVSNQDIVEAFSVQTFVERQKQMRQMPANM